MKRTLIDAGKRLSAFWHNVMTAATDEGIGWQQRRPSIVWAVLVILFTVVWMVIGYTVSGIVGRLMARRDRRLNQ